MQELISHFMAMGFSQEAATQQALAVLSRKSDMPSDTDPGYQKSMAAVGKVFAQPKDALRQVLTEHYDIPENLVDSYAHDIMTGRATNSDAIKAEALTKVAHDTIGNLKTTSRYAEAAYAAHQGQGALSPEDMGYLQEMHEQEKKRMRKEAEDSASEKLSSLAQQEMGRLGNMGQLAAVPSAQISNGGMTLQYKKPYPGVQ